MKQIKAFLRLVFRLDPALESATERTDRIAATVNGDVKWMLQCKPKIEQKIECDDGHIYKREK